MANLEQIRKHGGAKARQAGARGAAEERRPSTAHTHVAVPRAAAISSSRISTSRPFRSRHFASPETKEINAKQEADIRNCMTGYDERFVDMDKMGVDMQLVMPPPPQCYHTVALEYAVPAARMINDGIAEFVAKHKDRFIPSGTVPMQDGNEAAKELERCMKTLGFKGVEILTNVAGQELSDPAFAPFWKKAEELGALVIIHPNGFTEGQRLSRFYFNNVIGNPFETTLALHYLIFDGVLERHPNLKIFAMHGGGYLGAYSGRIDHAWGARSDCHARPAQAADRVSARRSISTPWCSRRCNLKALVKTFGVDHVIMGTDYPFDMLEFDPIGHINSVASFDDSTRAALAGGNLKKLVGI